MEPFGYNNSHHKHNSTIAKTSCRKYKTRTYKNQPKTGMAGNETHSRTAKECCSRFTLWQAVRTDLGKKAFSSPKALK